MSPLTHIRKTIFKVSQAGMASIAKTTQATVSRWENGELSPDLRQMELIREEARERGLLWNDAWFFDAPRVKALKEAAA